ncbi:MAG: hypothetical protein JW395_2339 [Nitrospira sp.]|nr:hypothetical protein [Nitrospira sp.]
MGGSLMLGMVPCMFDRLSLRQSADGKDAEHQEDRQEFKGAVFHQIMTIIYRRNVTGGSPGLSRRHIGSVWSIRSVWFIWLVSFNQTDEIDRIDQIDPGGGFFSILLSRCLL